MIKNNKIKTWYNYIYIIECYKNIVRAKNVSVLAKQLWIKSHKYGSIATSVIKACSCKYSWILAVLYFILGNGV